MEAARGECGVITARDHAVDHLFAKLVDGACVAECRHRPPELVGFGRGEAGGDDRPLHRLFRSEAHTSELQSLMRISYAVICLKKKKTCMHTHYASKNSMHMYTNICKIYE